MLSRESRSGQQAVGRHHRRGSRRQIQKNVVAADDQRLVCRGSPPSGVVGGGVGFVDNRIDQNHITRQLERKRRLLLTQVFRRNRRRGPQTLDAVDKICQIKNQLQGLATGFLC